MRYLVAIPCMDMMHTQFVHSLIACRFFENTEITLGANSLIYDTRNQLAEKAINEKFDRILWFDSDMTFKPDFAHKLAKHLDDGMEFVSGLYMTRKPPIRPTIFKTLTANPPKVKFYDDYPRNSVFEIEACGFGGVMMNVSLLRRVGDAFGLPFSPIMGVGEDLSFCHRVKALGVKMYCDSSLKMGHIGYKEITEDAYECERDKIKNTEQSAGRTDTEA